MGNKFTTALGDTMLCFRDHENKNAINRSLTIGSGRDINDAVLAATQNSINSSWTLVQTIRLTFSCKNLPNFDTFTRTDGMVALYEKRGIQWHLIGLTEVIMDNLNPEWVKSFDVPFKFEEKQLFKAIVYDVKDYQNLHNFKNHDFIGELIFTLHEVVTAQDQIIIRKICKDKKENAILEITGEEIFESKISNEQLIMVPVFQIPQNNKIKGSIIFFILYKLHKDQLVPGIDEQIWRPIYKSEIKSQNKEPNLNNMIEFEFNQLSVLIYDMCGQDEGKQVKIEIFKSEKNGLHKNLGTVNFTVSDLRNNLDKTSFVVQKQQDTILSFKKVIFQKRNSFLEYVFGGCEINLAIAIDFTLSNGKINEIDSLHHHNLKENQYYQALKSVGDILQFYDSDKQFPTFGFGAKLNLGFDYREGASHCFALNGNIFDPECDGLDGVLEAYKNAIKNLNFFGPTHFNEIINTVNNMAEDLKVSQDNQKYIILLIITDGIINDMEQTIDEIVRGSSLPLSIIIVGVGDAEFNSMDILDADDEPLFSKKFQKQMDSDIVQFVPFCDYKNDTQMLAKKTLEEIPRQFLSFMERQGILPKNDQNKERINLKLQRKKSKIKKNVVKDCGDDFFVNLKKNYIQEAIQQGIDEQKALQFINKYRIPEYNLNLLIEGLKNKSKYNNHLNETSNETQQNQGTVNDSQMNTQPSKIINPLNSFQNSFHKNDFGFKNESKLRNDSSKLSNVFQSPTKIQFNETIGYFEKINSRDNTTQNNLNKDPLKNVNFGYQVDYIIKNNSSLKKKKQDLNNSF